MILPGQRSRTFVIWSINTLVLDKISLLFFKATMGFFLAVYRLELWTLYIVLMHVDTSSLLHC